MAFNKSLPVGNRDFAASNFVSSRDVAYKDIDLTFAVRPGVARDSDGAGLGTLSGDVYKKIDAAAITQSLKTLLLTNQSEKPFQPTFGANLQKILFDLADTYTENDIVLYIKSSIRQYEPRAIVDKIYVDLGPYGVNDININAITVTVVFRIKNSEEQFTFSTVLNRLR